MFHIDKRDVNQLTNGGSGATVPEVSRMALTLQTVNHIVAVGSVDGVCTAAAVLRATGNADQVGLQFCQAFTVDKIDPTTWPEGRNVLCVDLAVNVKDPAMTVAFLKKITDAGHRIVGVLDEHDGAAWEQACAEAGLDFNDMAVKPVSGKGTPTNSSGALLSSLLNTGDSHHAALCEAADAGDRGDFTTHFAGIVNSAVKSAIADDSRRVYLARHLSREQVADATITGWIEEYQEILRNNSEVIAARQQIIPGMAKVETGEKRVDVTALMTHLYGLGNRIVVVDGNSFNPTLKRVERQISFGAAPGEKVDLLAALKGARISASGFALKATVSVADQEAAMEVVKGLLG